MKTAILFGATGFIGSHLLNGLLSSPDYSKVTAVVRRPLDVTHPKLKTVIGDFTTLPNLKAEIVGDELFIALGTTRKHTPDRDDYYRIDHDYPVLAAKIAKENGATSVFVVTAIGADADSNFFYVKTKGETERDIRSLHYQHTNIFQPSMIVGDRKEKRALEKTLIHAWNVIDTLMIGPLEAFKGIDGKDVAAAMLEAAKKQSEELKTYRWREMRALLPSR